jgi:hypothetical protein
MNKVIGLMTGLMAVSAYAETNPIFGNARNQVMLNLGQGVNGMGLIAEPDRPVPFNMVQLAYSQPTTFFRIPGRQTFSVIQTIGYGTKYEYTDYNGTIEWNWGEYATQIAMLSGDISLYDTKNWYFGVGMGGAMQGKQNKRENTKFLLGYKLFAGYRMTENWNAELFMQHFSNGDTGERNYVYNFFGLGLGYSF